MWRFCLAVQLSLNADSGDPFKWGAVRPRVFDSVGNPPEAVTPTLNQNLVSTIDPKNVLLGPPGLTVADPTGKIPTTYSYQFSVQTRLPWNMSLDTA